MIPGRACRRGMGLVGMLVLLLVFVGIGVAFSLLARQTGRSSHWFHDSQFALDLAECALKEAAAEMREGNGTGKSQLPSFEQLFQMVSAGNTGQTITLLSDAQGQPPDALKAYLDGPIKEFAPSFEVTVKLVDVQPLWTAPVAGFPPLPGERAGTLQLTARASVKSTIGVKVERTLVIEKDFKVVSLLPPLVGRFALFTPGQPEVDPNFVRVTQNNGNGATSGVEPLEIRAGPGIPLVKNNADLDAGALSGALAPDFLDRNGWVFLGHAGGGSWDLHLAHGWGDQGESPLLESFIRGPAPGTFADDLATAIRNYGTVAPGAVRPVDGLYYYDHGFCDDYSVIGIPDDVKPDFTGAKAIKVPSADPPNASCLRLFGSPSAFSPTLVLGSVQHVFIRRLVIVTQLVTASGDSPYRLFVKMLDDYPPGTTRSILEHAFGGASAFPPKGPRVCTVTAADVLSHLLDAPAGGSYGADGLLKPSASGASTGAAKTYASQLHRPIGALPAAAGGPTSDAYTAFSSGDVDLAGIYKENLHNGLAGLAQVLSKKLTYTVTKAGAARLVVGGKLRVPGVVYVNSDDEIALPACTVAEGGILVARGPIKITGNITAAAGGKEPLTLVSLKGDVTVAGAAKIQAYLVAASPDRRVKFGSAPLEIVGGVATGVLDLKGLKDAAARSITYAPDYDPNPSDAARLAASMRAYYGGEERLSLSGSEAR